MTTVIDLPFTVQHPGGDRLYHEYSMWCFKNLFVPGEPKSWALIDSPQGNIKYSAKKIIFYHEEDALAFKLRFGL